MLINSEDIRKVFDKSLNSSGKILLDYLGKTENIKHKGDKSNVVTEADIASEKNIVSVIRSAYPEHNIIGEETGFDNKKSDFTWVVDPIDGTANYASAVPWFGILMALLYKNEPVVGAMYLPLSKTLYYCEKGKGVFKDWQKISLTPETELAEVLCSYGIDFSENFESTKKETEFLARFVSSIRNLRCTNCLIDFCHTIEGKYGASVNMNTKIWDIAPFWLMLKEEGGLLAGLDGKEITFDLSDSNYLKSYQIIGGKTELVSQIAWIVRKCGLSETFVP